jgi:RimJ/RimL family protein N-acetyltransferase
MSDLSPTLTTARLRLAAWNESDAPDLRRVLDESDAHLRPWIPFMQQEPRSLEATREWLKGHAQHFATGEHLRYAIRELSTGALIGETMLLGRGGPGAREIGYWLHRARCGRGYATEATTALLPIAFGRLGLARVIMRCDERNLASQSVARRLGAVPIDSERLEEHGRAVRLIVFGLTREQWLAATA